jgi:uncharacterized protein DUF4160
VATVQAGGVRFKIYSQDHGPSRHVHGQYDEIEVIVDLRADRTVMLSRRRGSVKGRNPKSSDVRKILNAATENFDKLVAAWERIHHDRSPYDHH